jgi:2-C-methyl-D-erythritol 4-phosphate cytidylyltransferase
MGFRKNVLIVLAAGQGKRMGKDLPKMLLCVHGEPLIYWTLKSLDACRAFQSIVLVVPPRHRLAFERNLKNWRFRKPSAVVNGGRERTDSTRNALKALPENFRLVGIHDGARPFVDPFLVEKCFLEAEKFGSAILAVPCTDTVKLAGPSGKPGGKNILIRKTFPRRLCWSAQTPQVFRRDIVEKMHRMNLSKTKTVSYTDDASIAESLGFKVRIVPGSYENIKVTTPDDLAVAELILKRKGVRHLRYLTQARKGVRHLRYLTPLRKR